ncbi:MAG: nodulation protein NfeD [Thiohalocapsa sp.]|jgi:membrane-bound serine protease (ClpP class)
MNRAWASAWLAMLLTAGAGAALAAADEPPVVPGVRAGAILIDIDGAIGPATTAYLEQAIADADSAGAPVLILRMDTPGGLDTAMRAIVKAINASAVPVVGYVAPSGARAASAGTYILYACHVAAMAPGTNLGAATPVQLGGLPGADRPEPASDGDENGSADGATSGDATKAKLVNDAVAYIRSLAQLRGRNADWAERAVRGAESLPAEEALDLGVVDLIARDVDDLLARIDGRSVPTTAGQRVLETAGIEVVEVAPDWHSRLLAIIGNPNLAYILLLVGIYGLIYEFSNPGAVFPGTVGAVSLVLALYAFQLLPINYAGAALMLLGLVLMVAEAFAPSFGALGISGVAAFVVGSLILVDTDAPGFGLSVPLVLALAVTSALLLFAVVTLALRSRRRPVVTGAEELVGALGEAVSGFPGDGAVHLHGEVWSARSEVPIAPGTPVRVTGRDGLTLRVSPAPDMADRDSASAATANGV